MADAVILIPGFFGFGRFGTKPGATLEYFAGVRSEMERADASLKGRIVVHEPPPTGSIDERVASLHDAVRKVQEGRPLPHNAGVKAKRIHLVGHSAGGVDARLYANSGFVWAGGPRDEERRTGLSALGHVVTISAPLSGTPIATNATLGRDMLLSGLHLMSVLGKGRLRVPPPLVVAVAGVGRRAPKSELFASLLRLSADLDDQSTLEVQDFCSELLDDRQLLNGLRVASMVSRTAGLRPGDHPNLHCYVSVAPPPKWAPSQLFERLVYRRAYEATAAGPVPGVLPQGPVIGGRVIERLRDADPGDGVVPVMSQTLDGTAAGIVEGDHLDVVGHFQGGPGITVFKSNADFDMGRFRALWGHVASTLARKATTRAVAAAV
jgi:hypothetical protein